MISVKELALSDFQVASIEDRLCRIADGKVVFRSDSDVCPYDGSPDGGRAIHTALVLRHAEVDIEFLYREKFYRGLTAIATFNGEYRELDRGELPDWIEQEQDR